MVPGRPFDSPGNWHTDEWLKTLAGDGIGAFVVLRRVACGVHILPVRRSNLVDRAWRRVEAKEVSLNRLESISLISSMLSSVILIVTGPFASLTISIMIPGRSSYAYRFL